MAEYIEREAVLSSLRVSARSAYTVVECEPAADVAPVVHGRWVLGVVEPGYFTPGGNRLWICSECGYLASWMLDSPTYNYCHNCGARMDLE